MANTIDFKGILKACMYERNKHGACKKLVTISHDSIKKLQKASCKYGISASYIIDLLIKNIL